MKLKEFIAICNNCDATYTYDQWVELDLVKSKDLGSRKRRETRLCVECEAPISMLVPKSHFASRGEPEDESPCFVCEKLNCNIECETFKLYLRIGKWKRFVKQINYDDFRKNVIDTDEVMRYTVFRPLQKKKTRQFCL